jgi:sporulation protein YlmC with PRC-barrel domain
MDLVRDCLDKQLVDRNGHKMGRVDGIVIEVGGGRRPTVSAIEVGSVCLASRLSQRFAGLVKTISKRCGVVPKDPFRLPWSKVVSSGIEVIAGVEAEKTPALAWELWLRKNIIARIPGA